MTKVPSLNLPRNAGQADKFMELAQASAKRVGWTDPVADDIRLIRASLKDRTHGPTTYSQLQTEQGRGLHEAIDDFLQGVQP